MTLAVIITGGFLFINSQTENANADTSECATAPVYTNYECVFSDSFTRANASAGGVGNGWVDSNSDWAISSNQLMSTNSSWNGALLRPTTDAVKNGKIEFTSRDGWYGAVARKNITGATRYYAALVVPTTGALYITKPAINSDNLSENTLAVTNLGASINSQRNRVEFIATTATDDVTTNLTLNVYNSGTNALLGTVTYADVDATLQGTGQWGLDVRGNNLYPDDVMLYRQDIAPSWALNTNTDKVKIGYSVDIAIAGPTQTVALSDGGAGGVFSSASVSLSSANEYSQTVTYTPSQTGSVTITATPSVSPTTTKQVQVAEHLIGFIGDSITSGEYASNPDTTSAVAQETNSLGSDYAWLNRGVGGAATDAWAGNSAFMPPSIEVFQASGVDVVQIMLGTNDSRDSKNISTAQFITNMTKIVGDLKNAGFTVIINQPATASTDADSADKLEEFIATLPSFVDGEKVFLGDMSAYEYFLNNSTQLTDGVHPNDAGYAVLGQFWADAYNRVITDPLLISHTFTGSTGDDYTIDSSVGLEYKVDKDFAWFNVASGNLSNILVDSVVLTSADYTATSGSTVITLSPAYLNGLAVGTHSLTVRFADGVNFTSSFNVLAKSTGGNNNGGSTVPGAPNTGSDFTKFVKGNGGVVLAVIVAGVLGGTVLVSRKLLANRK